MPQYDLSTLQEFMSYVSRQSNNEGCWIWEGSYSKSTGYSIFKGERAYVFSYRLFYGSVPYIRGEHGIIVKAHIDHLCHTHALRNETCLGGTACIHRKCVNPLHLEPVTQTENTRRSKKQKKTKTCLICGTDTTVGRQYCNNCYPRPTRTVVPQRP